MLERHHHCKNGNAFLSSFDIGNCRYYHPNGYLNSVGSCQNGISGGSWWYYNNDGIAIKKKVYGKGQIIKDSVIVPLPKDSEGKAGSDPVSGRTTDGVHVLDSSFREIKTIPVPMITNFFLHIQNPQ